MAKITGAWGTVSHNADFQKGTYHFVTYLISWILRNVPMWSLYFNKYNEKTYPLTRAKQTIADWNYCLPISVVPPYKKFIFLSILEARLGHVIPTNNEIWT